MENVQYDAETLAFFELCDHYTALQNELGFESIWSIHDAGKVGLDFKMLKSATRIRYQFVREDATTAELMADIDDGLTLIKDGDHRLSRPEDIDLLVRTVAAMA